MAKAKRKDAKKTEAEQLMQSVRTRFTSAEEGNKKNALAGLEALKFKAGRHYTDDELKERRDNGLVSLTVNKVPQFVRQVTGDIRLNKPAIKVRPVDDRADPEIAELYNGIIRNIESVSRAQTIYATAADNSVTAGFGAWRINKRYVSDESFDQELFLEPIPNALSVYFDPLSIRVDRSDAMYAFVVSRMSRDEFTAKYPKSALSDFDFGMFAQADQAALATWISDTSVRVAEYWCVKTQPSELAMLADGSVVPVEELPEGVEVRARRTVENRKVYQYIVNGIEVLEGPIEWDGPNIPIIPVVGEETWIGDERVCQGLVAGIMDSQRLYNYVRSTSALVQSSQPKAPWLVTPKQIGEFKQEWADAGKANFPYLPFNPDPEAGGPPQRSAPPQVASGLVQEAQLASDDMKAATGIYDASLGARSNETSGRAIEARERAGDVSNFVYIDNLSVAIAYCGQQLVDLIPRVYDTERAIRILGEDGKTDLAIVNQVLRAPDGMGVQVKNDLSVGRYDVVVDVGPSFTTRRREASTSIVEFIRAFPPSAPVLGDVLAKVQDWPEAEEIAKRLQALLPPQLQGQPVPQAPTDPAREANAQLTMAKAEGQALDNFAKSQALGFGAQDPAAMAGAPMEPELGGYLG